MSNTEAISSLPNETVAYLRTRQDFDYARDSCECGLVTLLRPEQLGVVSFTVSGYERSVPAFAEYSVRCVDLLADVEWYSCEGVLAWMIDEKMFCTVDNDHDHLFAFPGVSWGEIVSDAPRFLNVQWQNNSDYWEPWKHDYLPVG